MRMLLQQTWRYLPAQIIAPAVQLAALLLWAHLLPLAEIGRLTLVVATQEVLFAGVLAGWSHFMLRYRAREHPASFRQTEIRVLAAAIVVQLALLAVLLPLVFGSALSVAFCLSAAVFVTCRSLSVYLAELARARDDAVSYTCLQALFPALGLALAIVAIAQIAATAQAVLCALALAQAVGIVIAAARSGPWHVGSAADAAILKSAVAFALPISLAALVAAAALNAPRYLVDHHLGLAAAGLFGVIYGLGLRASSAAVMLVTAAAYPLAVRAMEAGGPAAGHRQLASNSVLVALVLCPAGFGLIGIAPSFVQIVLPVPLHAPAATLLPLAVIYGMLRYLRSHTTDQVFLLHGRPGAVTAIALLELALVLGLTFAGLKLAGLPGVFFGAVAAAGLACLASIIAAHSRFGFAFPVWTVLRIAAAACAMMLVLQLLPATATVVGLALRVAAGGAVYALCLLICFPRLSATLVLREVRA